MMIYHLHMWPVTPIFPWRCPTPSPLHAGGGGGGLQRPWGAEEELFALNKYVMDFSGFKYLKKTRHVMLCVCGVVELFDSR